MEDKSLKGTRTEMNLYEAFKAESAAIVKYGIFADESQYTQIENIFLEIAKLEQEHAEVFLKLLNAIGDDVNNLKNSVALEGFASSIDYPQSARIAREEGFDHIADIFNAVAQVESSHKATFTNLLDKLEKNTLLKSTTNVTWQCLECGYIHVGTEPPSECPICSHDSNHFKII